MKWRNWTKIGGINGCKHTCRVSKACRTLCIVFVGTNFLALVHIYSFGYFHLSSKSPYDQSATDADVGDAIAQSAELQSSHETFNPATQVPLEDETETEDFLGIEPNPTGTTERTDNVTSMQHNNVLKRKDNQEIFVAKYEDKEFCNVPRMTAFHRSVSKYFRQKFPPGVVPCRQHRRYPQIFTTDLTTRLIELESPLLHNLTNCCYEPVVHSKRRRKKGEKWVIITATYDFVKLYSVAFVDVCTGHSALLAIP